MRGVFAFGKIFYFQHFPHPYIHFFKISVCNHAYSINLVNSFMPGNVSSCAISSFVHHLTSEDSFSKGRATPSTRRASKHDTKACALVPSVRSHIRIWAYGKRRTISMLHPVSSSASRSAAWARVSPNSTMPPGNSHFPFASKCKGSTRFCTKIFPSSLRIKAIATIFCVLFSIFYALCSGALIIPQRFHFKPEPQGQGSFLPIFGCAGLACCARG